ncbi:uncharacterized protein LOC128235108 [Mya arenaria]|uniref:uncharacterized protein LOC128235108 n=1 Tax=Mya arenaria TaxID=6604 RepID=UPI0022E03897|nr:uncharacterized protein LOC128235108 [Mya arenaria]
MLLPSDKSQADIHVEYEKIDGARSISLSTFTRVWRELCPHIVLAKPKTDLCFRCQTFSCKISQSGALSEDDKMTLLDEYESHVESARHQREQYRMQCDDSKVTCSENITVEGAVSCSLDATVHYSWDFAQQVHIPHHSQQVGPLYFKTARRCEVFGVCCEGSEKQVFYLGDEGVAPGKGANTVVSYLHHYLENYGLGEEHAQFLFDNCQGQNKNNAVLGYAVWRTLTGGHKTIQYSLMLAGHTKFSCDWHFGVWKNRWRHMDAETVEEVASTVAMSSRNGHNIPHIVDGNSKPVLFYDWSTFFKGMFKPLKNISKYHSFEVSSNEPGVVRVRKFVDAPEEKINILKTCQVDICVMPEQIFGEGINAERQWYLHDVIRDFCRSDHAKNTTCPLPLVAKEGYSKAKKQKLK